MPNSLVFECRPCLGYVPDGVKLMKCLGGSEKGDHDFFIKEMRQLERGYTVWSRKHEQKVVLWGRLFLDIADFPAAQEMCGARGVSALHPCRLCLATKGTYGWGWVLRTKETPSKGRSWLMDTIDKWSQVRCVSNTIASCSSELFLSNTLKECLSVFCL
jgi:hypothetical protein